MTDLTPRQILWIAAFFLLLLGLASGWLEHRRRRRRDLDRHGIVPWQLIEILGFFAALAAAALALRL